MRQLAWGWRDGRGRFTEIDRRPLIAAGIRPPVRLRCHDGITRRIIEIVLATAHLDHDTANNDPTNLRVYCQMHHLEYDRQHHRVSRFLRLRAAANTLDLFEDAQAVSGNRDGDVDQVGRGGNHLFCEVGSVIAR